MHATQLQALPVITSLALKIKFVCLCVCWNMTLCGFVICYRHFGGIKIEITSGLEVARSRFDPPGTGILQMYGVYLKLI